MRSLGLDIPAGLAEAPKRQPDIPNLKPLGRLLRLELMHKLWQPGIRIPDFSTSRATKVRVGRSDHIETVWQTADSLIQSADRVITDQQVQCPIDCRQTHFHLWHSMTHPGVEFLSSRMVIVPSKFIKDCAASSCQVVFCHGPRSINSLP